MCWFLVLVCAWKICIILKTLGLKVLKVRGQPGCWDSTLKTVRNTTEAQFCREERPPTDKRSHSWSKDGAALDHEGHPGTDSHCHVSCQPPKRIGQVLLGEIHSVYSCVEKEPSHLQHQRTTFFMQSASDCFFRAVPRCGRSAARPPVLMTLWMTLATWPCRRELSSLTRSSRQEQRTSSEPARRIRPTTRSDSSVDANRCLPEGRQARRTEHSHRIPQKTPGVSQVTCL